MAQRAMSYVVISNPANSLIPKIPVQTSAAVKRKIFF
jgi:hypothetical protein